MITFKFTFDDGSEALAHYGENLGGSYGVSRNGQFVEDPESVKKRHRRARKKTNTEYRDYQNSTARRVRNLFGYK